MSLLEKFKQLDEPRLVKIEPSERMVLAGDTHGDLEASQQVVSRFLNDSTTLVFLGDYVDRGANSRGNIDFLLEQKIKHPEQVYLLQGNHEGYPCLKFTPVDFWKSLNKGEMKFYQEIFERLPLAVSFKNVIAVHGALPDLENLEQIDQIELGDDDWKRMVWGDFVEGSRPGLRTGPQFGENYFNEKMKVFNKQFLIRSHQSNCPRVMFDERCYTIFTCSAEAQKTVALISNGKKVTRENITIEQI